MISLMVWGFFSFHRRISSSCASHQRRETGQLCICASGVPTPSTALPWRGMALFTCQPMAGGTSRDPWRRVGPADPNQKLAPPGEAAGACHDIQCITAQSCCMSRPADRVRVAPRGTLRHHHSREHLQTQTKHVHALALSAPETSVCDSSAHALVCKMPM